MEFLLAGHVSTEAAARAFMEAATDAPEIDVSEELERLAVFKARARAAAELPHRQFFWVDQGVGLAGCDHGPWREWLGTTSARPPSCLLRRSSERPQPHTPALQAPQGALPVHPLPPGACTRRPARAGAGAGAPPPPDTPGPQQPSWASRLRTAPSQPSASLAVLFWSLNLP